MAQRKIMEEIVDFNLYLQRDKSPPWGVTMKAMIAGARSYRITSQPKHEAEENKLEIRRSYIDSVMWPPSSSKAVPPELPQMVPPSRNEIFKYPTLRGDISHSSKSTFFTLPDLFFEIGPLIKCGLC